MFRKLSMLIGMLILIIMMGYERAEPGQVVDSLICGSGYHATKTGACEIDVPVIPDESKAKATVTWKDAGGAVREIPQEEAKQKLDDLRPELDKVFGVQTYGLDGDGIVVYTDKPESVPTEHEGFAIKTRPAFVAHPMSHTNTTPSSPLYSGDSITDIAGFLRGSITVPFLLGGLPYAVFPAHMLHSLAPNGSRFCSQPSPKPPTTALVLVDRFPLDADHPTIYQPPTFQFPLHREAV